MKRSIEKVTEFIVVSTPLPEEVWTSITDLLNQKSQFILTSLSKWFYKLIYEKHTLTNEECIIPAFILEKCKHLKTLTLSDETTSIEIMNKLQYLTNLTELSTTSRYVGDIHLNGLTKLKTLDIRYSNGDVSDNSLTNLTNLTDLSIGSSLKITDASLSQLTNLTELNIYRSHTITDKGIKNMTNMKTLRLLECEQITNKAFEMMTRLVDIGFVAMRCVDYGAFLEWINKMYPLTNYNRKVSRVDLISLLCIEQSLLVK